MTAHKIDNSFPPIQIARWADHILPSIDVGDKFPIKMCNSDGKGRPLLKEGDFGADIIRFASGDGVKNHTHQGSHILFVVSGGGFVEYNGQNHVLEPGVCYLIPSMVDHAIKATSELVLIVVGNNHRNLSSPERLDVVD